MLLEERHQLFEREADGCHSYVTFVADEAVLEDLAALGARAPARTRRSPAVTVSSTGRYPRAPP